MWVAITGGESVLLSRKGPIFNDGARREAGSGSASTQSKRKNEYGYINWQADRCCMAFLANTVDDPASDSTIPVFTCPQSLLLALMMLPFQAVLRHAGVSGLLCLAVTVAPAFALFRAAPALALFRAALHRDADGATSTTAPPFPGPTSVFMPPVDYAQFNFLPYQLTDACLDCSRPNSSALYSCNIQCESFYDLFSFPTSPSPDSQSTGLTPIRSRRTTSRRVRAPTHGSGTGRPRRTATTTRLTARTLSCARTATRPSLRCASTRFRGRQI